MVVRRPPSRVRLRIAIWYAVSLTLIFSAVSVCVFTFVRMGCMIPIRAQLGTEFSRLEKALLNPQPNLAKLDSDGVAPYFRITESLQTGVDAHYASRGWTLAQIPEGANDDANGYWVQSASGKHFFVQQFMLAQPEKTFHITIAQDAEQAYASVQKLALALLMGIPLVLLASLGGGYVFAGRVLAPLGTMTRKAQEITADKLSERLPIQNPADEFGHLAGVFNNTFERLENSFERLHRFTADASHELRTPLAVIRSVGENALQQARDPAHYENVIGSMLEETDRLTRLLDGLLTLTRAEEGQLPMRPETIALGPFTSEVVNCLRVLAEEKQQTLTVDDGPELNATADRATLRQALINLVANAIRYTPERGAIHVQGSQASDGSRVIAVRDNGPGIAPEHQAKIFERFYRIDTDRSRETGGAGLGLAIARQVVAINGGVIALESQEGQGSTFSIVLA